MRVSGHELLIRILFLYRRCAMEQGVHDPGVLRKLFGCQMRIAFHHLRRFPRARGRAPRYRRDLARTLSHTVIRCKRLPAAAWDTAAQLSGKGARNRQPRNALPGLKCRSFFYAHVPRTTSRKYGATLPTTANCRLMHSSIALTRNSSCCASARTGHVREALSPGLRSFPVGWHVIFHEPVPDGIAIVRVLHSALHLDAQFSDDPREG